MKRLIKKASEDLTFQQVREAISAGFPVLGGEVDNKTISSLMDKFESYVKEACNSAGISLELAWGYENPTYKAFYIDGGNYIYLNEDALNELSSLNDEVLRWIAFHEIGHAFDYKNGLVSQTQEWTSLLANDNSGLADWGKDVYKDRDLPSEAFANAFFAVKAGEGYKLQSEEIENFIKGLF